MIFKSATQPLCRYCGKPIRKATKLIYFKAEPSKYDIVSEGIGYVYVRDRLWPRTLQQAQSFVNERIVSITYHEGDSKRIVNRASVWDGETYVDPYFCNGDHARRFGYVMARDGFRTKAHEKAT